MIGPGDDLAALIADGAVAVGSALAEGDVVVIAQKIVSKAEDRHVDLRSVVPSPRARELAAQCKKDPRLVEVILSESSEILRWRPGLIIVVHHHGTVMANAGIDQSNVAPEGDAERVLLLPADPDESARRLRRDIRARTGRDVAVIVNDSIGRAWRNGTVGIAVGAAGLPVLDDQRQRPDLFGQPLVASIEAVADELAAAASLIQGQADEGIPVVVIRGFERPGGHLPAAALVRPKEEDLFR